jgi:hypothetical protein
VTDEALTAQAVETPCTPRSGFSYTRFGFLFAVNVTEMAKLGPERDLIPNRDAVEESTGRLLIDAFTHATESVCFDTNASQRGVEQVVH